MSLLRRVSSCRVPLSTTATYLKQSPNLNAWRRRTPAQYILTKIAAYTSSTLTECQPESEPLHRFYRSQGNHILWIDLQALEFGRGEDDLYTDDEDSTNWKRPKELLKMMKELRRFIKADARKPSSERIDSVQWYVNFENEPTAKMWRALDGLSPKHLQIVVAFEWNGGCKIKGLDTLQQQWDDLETLSLVNVSYLPELMKQSPKIFSRISSLTLNHCCGLNMIPPHVTRLKHVRIIENNACDMFIYAVDNNPLFAQVLEVLEIQSTSSCDFSMIWEPQEFREGLLKCTNLREFKFAAGHHNGLDADLGLASYIPSSVEKLELQFTRSLPLLHGFDDSDWMKCASDPTWLPNLKSFELSVDPNSRVGDFGKDKTLWDGIRQHPPRELSAEEFDREFEEKRNALYDLLKESRPSMKLVIGPSDFPKI